MRKKTAFLSGILAAALAVSTLFTTGFGLAKAGEAGLPTSIDVIRPVQAEEQDEGVLIARVIAGSPAAQAGLRRGDILVKIGDVQVNSAAEVSAALSKHSTGDEVSLTFTRGGDERQATVKLGERNGRAYLGVMLAEGSQAQDGRPEWGMPMPLPEFGNGAMVVEVVTGSPADKAGVVKGDVITAVDGKPVDLNNPLASAIGQFKPGDSVKLTLRGSSGQTRDVTVTLGENPDAAGKAYLGVKYAPVMEMGRRGGESMPKWELPKVLPMLSGVVVREVITGSPADKAGLRTGDVIVSIGDTKIESAQALSAAVGAAKPGDVVTVTLRREVDGKTSEVKLKVTLGENPDKKGAAYLGVRLGGVVRQMLPSAEGSEGMRPELPDWLSKFFEQLPDLLPVPGLPQPQPGQSL